VLGLLLAAQVAASGQVIADYTEAIRFNPANGIA
jgi:hypothetical protein